MENIVWNKYANHVIRTVTECLGGISCRTMAETDKRQAQPKMITKPSVQLSKIPPEYTELLKEFVHRLSAWPQFQGWYPIKHSFYYTPLKCHSTDVP